MVAGTAEQCCCPWRRQHIFQARGDVIMCATASCPLPTFLDQILPDLLPQQPPVILVVLDRTRAVAEDVPAFAEGVRHRGLAAHPELPPQPVLTRTRCAARLWSPVPHR